MDPAITYSDNVALGEEPVIDLPINPALLAPGTTPATASSASDGDPILQVTAEAKEVEGSEGLPLVTPLPADRTDRLPENMASVETGVAAGLSSAVTGLEEIVLNSNLLADASESRSSCPFI